MVLKKCHPLEPMNGMYWRKCSAQGEMDVDRDFAIALQLQGEFNVEANSVKVNHNHHGKEKVAGPGKNSIIGKEWEYLDPTPDIHSLFQSFNKRFFWGKLDMVEVKWSGRMTTCAGVCSYEGRRGLCSVRLSAPLLKLRPRKDLVETLLHEMIHAYLFVTQNNRDRDGHGPEFHKHMQRINKEAGTAITVYHTFHDEVSFYQQHWWRCNGPCQRKPPFFGVVRRASNRAPGPNDFWWNNHVTTCGGTFIKIKEPEGFKSKGSANTKRGTSGQIKNVKDIRSFFPTQGTNVTEGKLKNNSGKLLSSNGVGNVIGFKDLDRKWNKSANKSQANDGKKIGGLDKKNVGGTIKKIGGFGGMLANKGGGTFVVTTKDKKPTVPADPSSTINNFVAFQGKGHVLSSGSGSGTSFQVNSKVCVGSSSGIAGSDNRKRSAAKQKSETGVVILHTDDVSPTKKVKKDTNLLSEAKNFRDDTVCPHIIEVLDSPEKEENFQCLASSGQEEDVQCPVCNIALAMTELNSHLDVCLEDGCSGNTSIVHCPVCNKELEEPELSQHLETCVQCVFSDTDSFYEERTGESGNSSDGRDVADKLYPCPCCMTWLEFESMNHHLDECLSSELLKQF